MWLQETAITSVILAITIQRIAMQIKKVVRWLLKDVTRLEILVINSQKNTMTVLKMCNAVKKMQCVYKKAQ